MCERDPLKAKVKGRAKMKQASTTSRLGRGRWLLASTILYLATWAWHLPFFAVAARSESVPVIDFANYTGLWGGMALSLLATIVAVRSGARVFGRRTAWTVAMLFQILSSLILVSGSLMWWVDIAFWGGNGIGDVLLVMLGFMMALGSAVLTLAMWLRVRSTKARDGRRPAPRRG
jgi:hypothetical protein